MAEKDITENNRRQGFQAVMDSYEGGDDDVMGDDDRDPMARIQPGKRPKLGEEELYNMYLSDILAGNWTDKLAKDLTREWLTVTIQDHEEEANEIENEMDDLDARQKFRDMFAWNHVFGDGYSSIGIKGNAEPSEPLDPDNLVDQIEDVVYLNAFSSRIVVNQEANEDPMSENYGDYSTYKYKTGNGMQEVDASRILHLQTKPDLSSDWGISAYTRPYDLLRYFASANWSLAQALYELTFKVYKTDLNEFKADDENSQKAKRKAMEKDWTQHRLAVIDKGSKNVNEEKLEIKSPSGAMGDVGTIIDHFYNLAQMVTGMPESRLFGAQAGQLSASQTDIKNYHAACGSIQETQLRDKAETLTSYLMAARNIDPNETEWSIEFNPLDSMDPKERAEIENKLSQAAKNLMGIGLMNRLSALDHLYDLSEEDLAGEGNETVPQPA